MGDQMRVVDLQDEPGIGDGAIFFVHRVRYGVEKFLLGRIVFVDLIARNING